MREVFWTRRQDVAQELDAQDDGDGDGDGRCNLHGDHVQT